MRSLEAVLPYASINYIVKNARKICTERDVELLGVTKEFSLRIFKIIELHIPSTTCSLLSTEVNSNSRPVRLFFQLKLIATVDQFVSVLQDILNDISNLSSLLQTSSQIVISFSYAYSRFL